METNIDYGKLALAVVADECRKNFFYFVKTFWDVVIKEEPVYNWHIPFLCYVIQKNIERVVAREPKKHDILINIPPGTTKTTIVTIMAPAWAWTVDASLRIISNSYSGEISLEQSTKSKDIITSDRYKELFPEVQIRKDMSAKGSYENTSGGARYTTSTGGAITGKHGHIILNDDPQNPKQAYSEPLRKASVEQTKTLATRKVNKKVALTITIMQRLHEEDVTGYLLKLKKDKILHICLPAELSDKVSPANLKKYYKNKLLDPVRLDREALDDAKIDLGSRGYAGQFEQSPTVEGGNIIKESWFGRISYADFTAIYKKQPMHFFLDTAEREKKDKSDNDPSGILAACLIDNNMYVYNAQKVYKTMPDLLKFLPEYMTANKQSTQSTLRIEPKSNGYSVIQMLRRITTLNVAEIPAPTDDKAVRLKTASPRVECGRVILVEGAWNDEFIDEVCGFPGKAHDEYVDILVYAINYLIDTKRGVRAFELF